uniref:Bifunctional lysine-specific demethylase and histidyl-hydroxylase n=1 Tax=Meloidogyne incognita TaxID=6306 RepID=A0A914KTD9_MELIC
MGKNKNKKNKQNSAGGNRFGSGPFNKKFKQDKPMNNNQGMVKDKGAVNGGNKGGGFNKKKAFDGGDKFEKRLMNEKSGVSVKKDDKNENAEVSNFQKQRPKENKMKNDGFSVVVNQPNKNFGQKTTPNTSVSSMGKESPKEGSGKKKVKFETDSSERNEHVKNDLVIKGDAQAKRFGSPRETPPTKRVKLETLTNSFSKDNELNGNAKTDTKVKKDGNVKNDDIGGKKDTKSKSSVKSNVVFDENGSIKDSDMEDESDLEDLEDEDDGEFLGFEDGEDDSLMDEEDDSSIFDEEEDEKGSDPDTSRELVDLNITGYNISTNTSNCIVLNAQKDYSTAANPFKLFKFSADTEHSVQVGLKVLQWILSPIVTDTFFNDVFQKRVLVLKRATNAYFDGFFNTEDFKDMLKNNNVFYGKDVNVASYVSGVRQTHNPLKKEMQRATITSALQHFQNGRSLQCVHPQVFNDKIWYICDALQEVFCSYVGANNYLTPAGNASFAPHYDNIDAFILQTEGRKHWKIYAPESLDDALPLESSDNLNESDFMEREPVFDGWLDQGDVLYVPRGFVHQANTGPDKHSHHVTISICRKFSYAQFFEQASSEFILLMTEKSKRLRGALPPHFFDMGGMADIAYPNEDSLNNKLIPYAKIFSQKFASDFATYIPAFIDLMAKDFMKTALPPFLSPEELKQTCIGGCGCDNFLEKEKHPFIGPETEVRFARMHGHRLIYEDEGTACIVHRMNNSRRYDENKEEQTFDFSKELEKGYITLCNSYPKWKTVQSLGCASVEKNIELATLLFNNCVLMLRQKEKK